MARIGIITCSNATQDLNCASVVCLADLRKRKGYFQKYPAEEKLTLVGIINCAGCPTAGAMEKILRKVRSLTEFNVDTIHFSYCLTTLCPFKNRYIEIIKETYPDLEIVEGTHTPRDFGVFQKEVKELLCASRIDMSDLIKSR
ncbi:CGGC domain-containing protein [Desulfofundulus thermocisternus]|uniref:CGGC domain-containing protein n=1 Tax=Desulfofundulus thermocisternus TaxID=42471 RepID=UPI00217E5519|nr:CGGC domain-containing protein [Desulfofundulus thermocisternus]MCS5696465.1 CGGC domain-containing protein [Desulfofundulus thermocisternus]